MKIQTLAVFAASLFVAAEAASCGGGTGIWNADQTVCCDTKCGNTCGGLGCHARFPGSESSCCQGAIKSAAKPCGTAPCVKPPTTPPTAKTCSAAGGILNSTGDVCCSSKCKGVCGGSDCDKRFTGSAPSCCQSEIRVANKSCGTAPCMLTPTNGGGGGTTCKIPCGRETVYGKPFEQGSTPDTQCCKGAEGCYSIDYNGRGTKCQVTVTCNKQAGEEPCGNGSDITPHVFTDTVCCKAGTKCVKGGGSGGSSSSCFDLCTADRCKNGGTCVTKTVGYSNTPVFDKCVCKGKFTGTYCDSCNERAC